MALRFVESFDHYSANSTRKWTTASSGSFGTPGYNGVNGSYLSIFDDNGNHRLKTLDSQATWIVGFAFRWYLAGWDNEPMFALMDNGTVHLYLVFRPNTNTLDLRRGGGTTLGTGTTQLKQGIWYYVELKATIHDTTGAATLRINETNEFALTSQDTRNGANSTADQVRWGGIGGFGSGSFHIADIYVCDGTGSSPTNDFLGENRVAALMPDGNGNSSQLDGSDGNTTDNYLLVDEDTPDDDTTYVESSDVGDKDTYTYEAMPNTGTVHGVQIIPCAKKTDAGTRSIVTVARHSGSEVDSAAHTLTTSYAYYHDIRETKPGGGSWSVSDVDGAEFGVKVNA